PPVQDADPSWTTAFVPRKHEKIASELLYVNWGVTCALCRIQKGNDSVSPGDRANFSRRIYASERIGDMSERKQSHRVFRQAPLQEGPVHCAFVSVDLNILERSACTLGDH